MYFRADKPALPSLLAFGGYWLIGFPVALNCAYTLECGVLDFWYGFTAALLTMSVVLTGRFLWISSRPIARA